MFRERRKLSIAMTLLMVGFILLGYSNLGSANGWNANDVFSDNNIMNTFDLSTTGSYVVFITSEGTAKAGGFNSFGELGNGTSSPMLIGTSPMYSVLNMSNVVRVSAGFDYTMFLKNDGTVWGTGNNRHGQLGNGTSTNRLTPVKTKINNVKQISTGYSRPYVLKNDGTVWYSTSKAVGYEKIDYVDNISYIDMTWNNSARGYVKKDGSVLYEGLNEYGQAGIGNNSRLSDIVKPDIDDVKEVSLSHGHAMYLKNDGTVWGAGKNDSGQLGDGTTENKSRPVKVNIDNVKKVFTGLDHTVFLKNDGTVWTVGNNKYKQLGDGTKESKSIPVKVNIDNVVAINHSENGVIALKSDGTFWFWGGYISAWAGSEPYEPKEFKFEGQYYPGI
ncbi:putative beta-lactamase-inhibitor protein II [Gottschalkia acidurici 9a]|uniref:Beta-lactamase-inhibitor protein II n=1 Tax=Gottschalkia acidurici (strain ATCC 7906 / DSM 604 / BCRC 14475 / CIP 104303 / KCTC 5404 / NCIMB 10678 / 9a) TaxID=1128398 RepID=K0B0V5_GOTA9|nr:RCC1 repeat protein [Gottschalkia acidurici]AFS78276.1 putative beta-lactamase-inhibitor protein II [Gottschalkia acidurici 9a]